MASERYIDLQLIKPLTKGTGIKGKISLKDLFKEYLDKLNVSHYDPCCPISDNNTPQSEFNEWVSVTDFGAKADGITDDTANIQAALNSGAKLVLFPQGTYKISSILCVNSNTVVYGYGATLLRSSNMTAMMMNCSDGTIGLYDASKNIKILGMSFNGNMSAFPSVCTLVGIGHATDILIRDCEFYNIPGWHGLELNAVKDGTVERCVFHDTTSGSELLQLDLMVNFSVFPWWGPFDNTPCNNITITDCTFYNAVDGIGSHSLAEGFPHTNVVISKNTFRNLTGTAIKPFNYQNIVVTDNIIDTVQHGIRTTNYSSPGGYVRNYVITGNRISNVGIGHPSEGRAINIHSCTDLIINNNSMYNVNRHAIGVDFCNRFTVDSNIAKDYGITASFDCFGVAVWGSNNGTVTNNILSKSIVNPTFGVSIAITSGGGTNITVENNTVTTPLGNFTFIGGFSGNPVIVGTNTINGKVSPYVSTITTNYSYLPTDSVLNVDTTAGNITITVNPVVFNKLGLVVKKITADANTVTITPSTGTINGLASIVLTAQNQTANIKSDWINLTAIISSTATSSTASNGLSLTGSDVVLGQDVGAPGNPAQLISDREIPLNGNDLNINGTTLKYTFESGRFHLTDTNQDAQITARAASFSDTSPAGTSLLGLLNTADYFQMVLSNSTGIASLEASTPMIIGTQTTDRVDIITNGLERISILGPTGNVGIRTLNPTAQLHLPAGATGAENAPLKFTSGTLMTVPETGAMEYNGTHLYFTIGSTRYQIDQQTGTQGLDSVLAQNQALTANRLVSLGGHNIHFVNGFIGIQISPTAHLHLAGGGVSPGNAPLKFGNGAVLTTAEQGAVEYDGTNLFFTRTGTTRETIFTGVSGAAAPGTTAGATVTNRYGGDTNFLGDPNSWASVVIAGTTYKVPLYT